jgi:hypothetical protein
VSLSKIGEWMGEHQGEAYPLMIDLQVGYHQTRVKEQDRHRYASKLHYDLLVMPLQLTNTLVIFQSCRQWQRHLLLLFDALLIYSRTQEDETGEIMAMIRGMQRQHDGSPRRLVWDSRTAMFNSSVADADEMASFRFLEFTLEMLRTGCLEEWPSDELTKFVQLMIAWPIIDSQEFIFKYLIRLWLFTCKYMYPLIIFYASISLIEYLFHKLLFYE